MNKKWVPGTDEYRAYQRQWHRQHREQGAASARRWRREHPEKARAASQRSHKKRAIEVRAWLRKLKDVPCADCGIRYPSYVMQFDHVRGPKKFMIGRALPTCLAKKRLIEEIAKCEVVCANCHAERTWGLLAVLRRQRLKRRKK